MNPQPNTPASLNEAVAWFTDWHPDGRKYAEKPHGFNEPGIVLDDPESIRDAWKPLYLAAPRAAIDAREQEATAANAVSASNLVPGQMHCARCKFQLTRTTLYMGNGAMGAGDSKTEPCPNGCGPLWPVTWEQAAREAWATCETLFERAKTAEDALAAVNPPRLVASRQEAPPANGEALSDALNEFVPEWDDKAYEIRKLRAKIKRITDALATPSEALSPAKVAQPVEHVAQLHIDNPSGGLRVWPEHALALSAGAKALPAGFYKLYLAAQPCASQGCGGDSSQVTK